MAESMQGLHRSHRCTEVSNANIGEKVREGHRDGLGTEEKKFSRSLIFGEKI